MNVGFNAPGKAPDDKPWLARKDWAARTGHNLNQIRGYTVVLVSASFGLYGLTTVALATDTSSQIAGSVFVAMTLWFCINWLLDRRFGKPVCILQTLPGVIGGWFRARVDVKLPCAPTEAVTVELANVVAEDGAYTNVWRTAYAVPASTLVRRSDGRCSIPVRIAIPKRGNVAYAPITSPYWTSYGEWHLTVSTKMPFKKFKAAFSVPVFATDQAPSEEQTAGEPALPPDVNQ